ncbi:Aste57867_2381 [Aphanomyces stellatus]|uniref:Plasma membrane ATPase n=1 Tax=Aphanomyces stellatus TaxID=120398 RepID=A0A485K7E6_9STRA|nr:hypothetical protein As57867_002375 [Aphanomyces stellatus]VFT79582.1 Aste57867_2381 [Aphanomyces stellatus]
MNGKGSVRETTPLLSASMRADDDRFYMGQDKRALLNTSETGLSTVEAARRLKQFGPNELDNKDKSPWTKLAHQFASPSAVLLWAAIVAEILMGDIPDIAALLFLQGINGVVGWFEELKAENAVAALQASLKPEAQVVRDGVHQTINASLLVPGDRITLTAGCAVPADCDLCEGDPILVDQAMFTGETFPTVMGAGDTVTMGSLVTQGDMEAIVSATGSQTYLGRVLPSMPATYKQEDGLVRPMLLQVTLVFTAVALVLVTLNLGCLLFRGHATLDAVGFSILLFLASVPLSTSQVAASTLALGTRKLAEEKILVTHVTAVERLASLSLLFCDKTGSLTRNKMDLQDDMPIYAPGTTREDVLVTAALACKWKEPPKDAIDTLVLNAIDLRPLDGFTLVAHRPLEAKRTESIIQRPNGGTFKVTKGAPHAILALAQNGDAIRDAVDAKVLELAKRGIRSIAVARTEDHSWIFLGLLTFMDPPRHDTKRTLELLHDHGVAVKMVTGDHAAIATETCRQLHLGPVVLTPAQCVQHPEFLEAADGFAQMDPTSKVQVVQLAQAEGYVCGITGHTETACLRQANVGIAIDGATDAAKAAADIVLTKAGLSVLLHGLVLARQICRRIHQHLTYRVASAIHLLVFFTVAIALVDPAHFPTPTTTTNATLVSQELNPVFSLPAIALVLLLLLNDGLLASVMPQDDVIPSNAAPTWTPTRFATHSGSVAFVSIAASILWLVWALDSWNPRGILASYGIGHLSFGQVQMAVYLQLALSDFFLFFSARSGDSLACLHVPGKGLFMAAALATASATLLALFWPFARMEAISLVLVGAIWLFSIFWFAVQELTKVALLEIVDRAMPVADRSLEWHRRNRLALDKGISKRDRSALSLDTAVDRLTRLDVELKALRQVLQTASASTH